MKLFAGIEPIIAILVGVGWFIVKALFDRRADADSWEEAELPRAQPPHLPQRNQGAPPPMIPRPGPKATPPPVILAPQRRTSPPPVTRTPTMQVPSVVVESAKLKESRESYARASQIQQAVAQRLTAVDRQTSAHKPAAPKSRTRPPAAAHVLRTFRNPNTVRQAFLASFVLNPPKALE